MSTKIETSKKDCIYTTLDPEDSFPREAYEEYCEINEIDYDPDNDEDYYDFVSEQVQMWAGDERANLDEDLPVDLLVIGQQGLWNGARLYSSKLKSRNIGEALFEIPCMFRGIDDVDMYGQNGDIWVDLYHHDGMHHMRVRKCDKGMSAKEIVDLMNECDMNIDDVMEHTTSLFNDIAAVYGWTRSK